MQSQGKRPQKGTVMFWTILRLVVVGYGLLLLALYLSQTWLIFPRSRDVYQTPAAVGWPYEDVLLSVNGETTHGWFIPAEDPSGTILFSHGNAGTIAGRLESIAVFRSLGFDVLIYDYGGYGKSTGGPSETRCYADIRAIWHYLTTDRGIQGDQIVLFGRSLGAAVAIDLATEVEPASIILESCFLSVARMARETFPIVPGRFLVRHKFDNTEKITGIRCPKLFIHSSGDEIVPYRHGKKLFELAPAPKTFLTLRGGHNDGFFLSADIYKKGLDEFLTGVFDRDTSG